MVSAAVTGCLCSRGTDKKFTIKYKERKSMDKTVLIDGSSLLNRAYLATPSLSTSGGTPTNAIFGFLKFFEKIMKDVQPKYVAVAFDLRAPTFRHKMYAGYKATRKPMPEALAAQVPILKECLRLMNVRICEMEGYEADDLLGTMSKRFDSLNLIYTGDSVNQLLFTGDGKSLAQLDRRCRSFLCIDVDNYFD